MKPSEIFKAILDEYGTQEKAIAALKESGDLDISLRSFKNYLYKKNDDPKKYKGVIKVNVDAAKKHYDVLKGFPQQQGRNSIIEDMIKEMAAQIKEIREGLMNTLEVQAKTIESLTSKSHKRI